MRIFLTGGGTAGHIYPAIAIGEELKKQADVEIFYVGVPGLLEEKIVEREGYKFLGIHSKPLYLKPSLKAIKSANAFFKGLRESKKYIKEYKPDAVVATGGYVSGPIGYAAHLKKVPLFIHESNAHYGVTTRFLDRYSDITFYPFKDDIKKFKKSSNKVYGGIPIRSNFDHYDGQTEDLVLSFGGSGGQKSINEAVAEIFNSHADLPFRWVHICGLNWEKEFQEAVKNLPAYAEVYTYNHELFDIMAKAKVVISGCGAQGLTEIAAMKKPSILIPKSYVKENHQYYNALKYYEKNAAQMITEDQLNGEKLLAMVEDIIESKEKMNQMSENVGQFYEPDSAKIIARNILEALK